LYRSEIFKDKKLSMAVMRTVMIIGKLVKFDFTCAASNVIFLENLIQFITPDTLHENANLLEESFK
jgi:hypothetical protein